MDENRDTRITGADGPAARDEGRTKLIAGRALSAIGVVLAAWGVAASIGGDASVSAGAAGAVLGISGYFLGSRRLGTTALLLSVAALFFGLTAGQGMIPGIEASVGILPAAAPGPWRETAP